MVRDGEQLAVLGEIACQEQNNKDLGKLAGLDGKGTNANPQLRAINLGTNKHGQDEQKDADGAKGVLVALNNVEIAHKRQRNHHERDGNKQNDELVHGKARRQTRYKRNANAREQKDNRQNSRVCSRGKNARSDVRRGKGSE